MRERSPSCIITAPSRDLGESERHRGTTRDGRERGGGRSRNSANGNRGLVCDGVLCTLLAFKIYLKGRERRGSGARLNSRCLLNMCLASTPLGSNLTSVSPKKKKSCKVVKCQALEDLRGGNGGSHSSQVSVSGGALFSFTASLLGNVEILDFPPPPNRISFF